jgi:hypothetical protein
MGTACCSQREKDGHSSRADSPDGLGYNKINQASEVQKSLPFISSYFEESKILHIIYLNIKKR